MAREPLPSSIRTRVGVVVASSLLLALIILPVEILALTRPNHSLYDAVLPFVLGVGLPLLGLLGARRLVRRHREDPGLRDRLPNAKASRILLIGNPLSVAVALLVGLPIGGWLGWVVAVVIGLAASYGVVGLAQREDPSVRWRWFGRS